MSRKKWLRSLMPEVLLEPLSWDNIDDVCAAAPSSSSEFYKLPATEQEAETYVSAVANQLRHKVGYWYNAYEIKGDDPLVGGGQVYRGKEELVVCIGWWVVADYRRKGYGKAIVQALERAAQVRFLGAEQFKAEIHQRNLGSMALAASMGYMSTGIADENGLVIFRKSLEQVQCPGHEKR